MKSTDLIKVLPLAALAIATVAGCSSKPEKDERRGVIPASGAHFIPTSTTVMRPVSEPVAARPASSGARFGWFGRSFGGFFGG
jgi:hypothetical protein